MSRCVIICASPYNQPKFIRNSINSNDYIICADGGFDTALKAGIIPHLIIGDFDSSKIVDNHNCKKVVLPTEKDDTDSVYCVRYAINHGYSEFLILGATGGRVDHMYANFSILKYICNQGCQGVVKDELTDIYYTETTLTINEKGKTVSVLPFGCENAVVTLKGFKYPAKMLSMQSDFPIGISNIALENTSTITVHNGGVLVMINKEGI